MPKQNDSTLDLEHNQVLLAWKTPEFVPHPRGIRWFAGASILVLSLTVYAIFTGSATMAIVFLLLGGVYYLTHNQEPKIIEIKITQLGIYVGKEFYPYNIVRAFWVVYSPPFVRRLYLRTGGKGLKDLKIELNHQDPVQVRQMLAREIPEIEGEAEGLDDIFIRLLRLQ